MPKSPRRTKTSQARSTQSLSRLQDVQVSAVRRISQAATRLVPALPQPPLADRLPSAKSVVNDNFDRVRRLLENQRRFTLALVDAVEPVTRKFGARKGPKRKSPETGRRPSKAPSKVEPENRSERQDAS